MSDAYLEQVIKPGQTVNALFAFLGVRVESLTPQQVVLRLDYRPELLQGARVVAGGVMATLADEAMAHVVLANLESGKKTATVEMGVRYFRPVLEGGLTATASLVNRGRRIISTQAVVTDDKGRAVARAEASFFVIGE